MANFDANEIERQAKRVDEQTLVFSTKVRDVVDNLNNMSNIVRSEDSSLSQEISSLVQTYLVLENKLSSNFKNLSYVMHNYAKKSLQIGDEVTQNVKISNSNLDSINSQLNSLNSDIPEIFDTSWE